MRIKFTRADFGERIKDMKFLLQKMNESCVSCSLNVTDPTLRDRVALIQSTADEYMAVLDRVIDIVEGKG